MSARLQGLRCAAVLAPLLFSACTPFSAWPEYHGLNECAATRFFITNYPKDSGISAAKAELARCGDLRKSDGVSYSYKFINEDVHEYTYGITFRESMGTAVTLEYVQGWTLPTKGGCYLRNWKIEPVVIPANGEVKYTGLIRTERDKPWCVEGTFDAPIKLSFTGLDANGHKVELRINMSTGAVTGF